jgi:anti-sigma regulatory factor (Ser/Thr protein kinase)
MSSGIAAPIGGRLTRARRLGHESARDIERKRLRRHLRATTLHTLESIASTGPDADAGALIAVAGDAATDLRTFVGALAGAEGGTAVAQLRRDTGAILHDTALQALEYLATDGYGAELSAETIRRVAGDTAVELRGTLLRLGAPAPCELSTGLQQVVAAARHRGMIEVELELDLDGSVYGSEAAALVGAAREALNNVHKHAHATSVLVRCETTADGTQVIVRDDGVGIDLARLVAGVGLRHSIIDRMTGVGGHADVASAPGHGTLVTLTTGCTQEVAA